MEMPSYDQYGKMFGPGPLGVAFAMDQMDLAKQFQDQKLKDNQQITRGRELSNLFEEQNMPTKLQKGILENQGMDITNRGNAVTTRIKEQTEGLQLDAAQKKLVMEAKKSDLDKLEIEAQRLAYSTNPAEREAGIQALKLHRDFIKLREEAAIDADKARTQHGYNVSMENLRHSNATSRQEKLAKLKADAQAARTNDKMTSDQYRAYLLREANARRAQGDYEGANALYQEAQYVTDLRASERPDPNVNKVDIGGAAGVPTVPPRPTPQPPGMGARPPAQVPAGLPPGAKQVGTSKGKPVYEVNGQRFILE